MHNYRSHQRTAWTAWDRIILMRRYVATLQVTERVLVVPNMAGVLIFVPTNDAKG